eukprot:CAMPEP_0195033244 /NCGR_PEP_ID=MMETSP0326_2-20130528/65149_1 /TAXON_ID=2866 ORGANISM="Crypthecodinium cohnii, Strain Seligo" /NCGR_SAMPLE_ID=MMETSP0326_2 /ASSEMBLY_ACC=CAM_ASM_000348 /LENGTH=86 /DNA_ID=CAMNT_0040057617 /DNA_START=100 /DNA_END=361 /DNA_ORIENTATION=-
MSECGLGLVDSYGRWKAIVEALADPMKVNKQLLLNAAVRLWGHEPRDLLSLFKALEGRQVVFEEAQKVRVHVQSRPDELGDDLAHT